MTQIKIGNSVSDLECLSSKVDKYPCYEITNGNIEFEYVDLACNSQHFARFKVERENGDGSVMLKLGDEQKLLSSFVEEYRDIVSTFLESDKEQFRQFVGFVSIKHEYGAATAIRMIIEDFLKANYLVPSILKHLAKADKEKLSGSAKTNGNDLPAEAIMKITVRNLFLTLMGNPQKNGGMRGKIAKSVVKFTKSKTGKKRQFSKDEWEIIERVFDLSSKIVHGKQYDAVQLFNETKVAFKLFEKYNKQVGGWNQ